MMPDLHDSIDVSRLSAEPEPDEAPQGGVQGWLVVVGSALVYFASFGIINSFGIFQDYYQRDFLSNYSPTAIAFIGTLQISLLYLIGPITGALFDSFGLKYLYPVGMFGCVISNLALSFTQSQRIWQQFLTQGLLFGLTVAFGAQPALAVVGQYFHKRRALAMGIVAAGSSAGGVCLPIMYSRFFPVIGFAWTTRVASLVSLVCYLIAMVISRSRLPPKPLMSVRTLLDFHGFKDKRYAALAIGSFLASLGLYSPYYYLEPFAVLHGVPKSLHSFLLPTINGASFFGRIIGGQLADQWGRLNVLYPATTLSGVLCLAVWLPSRSTGLIFVFACVYGFCSGIFISVTPAVIGQLSPTDALGARIGAFFSVIAIATLIGSPVSGAFVEHGTVAEYQNLIIFAGCTLTAGGTILFIARTLCAGDLLAKW